MLSSTYRLIKSYERRIRRKLQARDETALPLDMQADAPFVAIADSCRAFTMTTPERMYALYKAVQYVHGAKIPGDIVECGVWKGGSAMVCAMTLMQLGSTDRTLWLYDTYEGMAEPSDKDVDFENRDALHTWRTLQKNGHNEWCYSPVEEVERNLISTGYPREKIQFVKGKVEETIPAQAPREISILRLDTDWYESTHHELVHLYPRLAQGGVLILDDYGTWQGSREATDKYFGETAEKLLLQRIDDSARAG
ncbi:MAG: TylF/MycF/NovP-related O-methyltransferase, partial [Tepidisphaeraceae bacterium]